MLRFELLALDYSVAVARARGRDIDRDDDGLPSNLLMPPGYRERSGFSTPTTPPVQTHPYFWTPAGTRLSTGPAWPGPSRSTSRMMIRDNTSTLPSREDSSTSSMVSADSDDRGSPPADLLASPELMMTYNHAQRVPPLDDSHKPLLIQDDGNTSSSPTRPAESSHRPQVPDDAVPVSFGYRTDEGDTRALHQLRGVPVITSYFNSLPPLPKIHREEHDERSISAPSRTQTDSKKLKGCEVSQRNGSCFRQLKGEMEVHAGCFSRRKENTWNFQRTDALRQPKDSYITGQVNGKLAIL